MARLSCTIWHLWQCASILCTLLLDTTRWLRLCLCAPAALAAENLFLRKQLVLYQEGHVKPQRATNATRFTLVWLAQWFDWHSALVVVQPATFTRWRRQGFRRFWHGTPSPGRPAIPVELQTLIRQMAHDNLTWGQRRIANELRLKLGLRVSPRTVRKYVPNRLNPGAGHRVPSQRWYTFIRNHAWDLIVGGVGAELSQGAQDWAARIMQSLQRWQRRFVANGGPGTTWSNAIAMALLSDTVSVPVAWSADTVDVLSVADRSPPDSELSCTHEPCTARATQGNTVVVRPVVAALGGWSRARPPVRSPGPLSNGDMRTTPWRRVA